jgi:hypothetical protein
MRNISPLSSEEYRLKLGQFLHDEITATELLSKENQHDTDLKEAVVALARRNVKQGKV